MTSLLTKIKSLDTQISKNTENISNKQNSLTAGNNITIDENNIFFSSGGGSITQGDLDLKQDKLTAGTNITIDENNIISSSGGGITQSQLDTKQNTLTSTSNNGDDKLWKYYWEKSGSFKFSNYLWITNSGKHDSIWY